MNAMGIFKKGIVSGVCLLVPLISYADNLYLPDFHETVSKFYAAGSSNTAFMSKYPLQKVSYFQAFASKSKGDFVNFNESDNAYRLGMRTESYYRLNDRIMLYGRMSYDMNRGKHMSGSAFITPGTAPFDLVEMADSCAGTKKLEAYTLCGGVAYELNEKVSLGGKIFYRTSNYAKFKDLRHQNSRMNLNVDLGVTYQPWSLVTLGVSYSYHRQNESVGFGVYGNTDRQYYTLISYGGFFGRKEAFGESGYTSDTTPLFTQSHGGAFQALFKLSDGVNWFNELSYHHSDGRFGSGDDRKIIYSTHQGNELGYQGKFVFQHAADTHVAEVSLKRIGTENFENNYKESTDANGVSQIIYYGKNEMQDRTDWKGSVGYTFYKSSGKARSNYHAGTRVSFASRQSTASVYPYYRRQEINSWLADCYGSYNWFKKQQIFTLSVLLGYGSGGGTLKEDGTYTGDASQSDRINSRDDLLVKEFDYLTASRLRGQLSFGYERTIMKNISGYIVTSVSPTFALNTSFEDDSFFQAEVRLGVNF